MSDERDCGRCGWPLGVNPSWCEGCATHPRWDPSEPYQGRSDRPLFPGDDPLTDEEVRALGYEPTPRGWVLVSTKARREETIRAAVRELVARKRARS